ncbi:MAG: hypothetical protein QOF76_5407 [Solirubrobacteraceae bacterium]|jgi:hypothetical protein|nr:hypothetical protein [Solirubrobacteraceae bacterium]
MGTVTTLMAVSRTVLIATATALGAAAPALAAPTLEPLQPCYVSAHTAGGYQAETVNYSGSGFTPGSMVSVSVDDRAIPAVMADAGGAISGTFFAPHARRGQMEFAVTATQLDDPAQTAAVSSTVTNLTASLRPGRTPPRRRVTFAGRGFTDTTAPIYAHYRLGNRTRQTVRLMGPPADPCGVFAVRRPQFPFRPRPGHWRIRIDQSRRDGAETPAVEIAIRIRRVAA